jgi:hypothetical protein
MCRKKRNPARATPGFEEADQVGHRINSSDSTSGLKAQPGHLVDKYGHVHSEAIFDNWAPAAIRALGIRRSGQ